MSYSDLLRDPRWQRMRLEMFDGAGWKCERCHGGTKPLNVHHRHYRPGVAPWQYQIAEMMVLCDDCHKERHGLRETDWMLINVIRHMEESHRLGDWDEMFRAAELGKMLIDSGSYYKGLV